VTGSVRFDRAAEFYDQTRTISEEAMARTLELLSSELGGRGRIVEVGVGTGLLALRLHGHGLDLAGIDISRPMLDKLMEKAGGRVPFPLVVGDATRMPFRDGAFGAAYLRWVLHLIPDWRSVLAEVVRAVVPGGVFLATLGAYGGRHAEVQERYAQVVGTSLEPVGLRWADFDALDAAMVSLGARPRELPSVHEGGDEPLGTFIDGIRDNRYSWTWNVPEDVRVRAYEEVRRWAAERFGDIDERRPFEHATRWRAYDLTE
jgi:SAM-dependent methyltransferase